jgi:hypothetical protein
MHDRASQRNEIETGARTNGGFSGGWCVVWADAPMLAGTTMRLLDGQLAAASSPAPPGNRGVTAAGR